MRLGLSSGLFCSGFLTTFLYAFYVLLYEGISQFSYGTD
jgi:hypothetical protein